MTRLAITVEGRTEVEFINSVVTEHLRLHGVDAVPIVIGSGTGEGPVGGNVSVRRLVAEMTHLLRSFDAVTCLVDFYGFRKKGPATVEELEDQVRSTVARRAWARRRVRSVLPYIQRHEFEALLFSDVACFGILENVPDRTVEALRRIRVRFETPEDIDDGRHTAPSKRIQALIPDYHKVEHGSDVARRIGLPTIRAECPRFDRWIGRLESLGDDRSAGKEREPECG